MNIVFVGHVDHGKSTLVGRLLADVGALPEGRIEKLKNYCKLNAKPFEYAFLLDALADEQAQGITIDIARCFFKTSKRKYLILDAPGHIEFLKNLVTGAANAEAAFLVIDAEEGIQENTRRHAYMLTLLNIKQLIVLVNKMDLINYSEGRFNEVKNEFSTYLGKIGLLPIVYIPVCAREGENVARKSNLMTWYQGATILEALDKLDKQAADEDKPFRMPIQDIYKFTNENDKRRILAGQVSSGSLQVGDEIIVYPSGKKSTVKTIESFNALLQTSVKAGYSTGLTLHEQIYAKRGEVIVLAKEKQPQTASTLKVTLFWLGLKPLSPGKTYYLKLGTSKTKSVVKEITRVIDTSSLEILETASEVRANQAAECVLSLFMPIVFDTVQASPAMQRFVLVDEYDIAGGGIIQGYIEDKKSRLQEHFKSRNIHWVTGEISSEERAKVLNQTAHLILITGDSSPDLRKKFAIDLEKALFLQGKFPYYIGMANVKHSFENLETFINSPEENFHQFCQLLNILLNTGLIIVATATNLTNEDLAIIKMSTNQNNITAFWLSDKSLPADSEFIYLDSQAPSDKLLLHAQKNLNLTSVAK